MTIGIQPKEESLLVSDKKIILFAGDDRFLRDWYLKALNEGGYQAEGTTLSDLETNLTRLPADLVLIDLPDKKDSQKYMVQALRIRPSTPVVLLVELKDFGSAGEVFHSGAAEVLPKPVEPQLMSVILHRVIEEDRLLKENAELRRSMKLYSACQRITTQLDEKNIREATLTALMEKTEAWEAFYLDGSSLGTKPRMEGLVGLEETDAQQILDELLPLIRQNVDRDKPCTIALDNSGGTFKYLHHHDISEACIVPLGDLKSLLGLFVLLRHGQDRPWSAKVMEEVNFIARHAALALQNATLYAHAKEMAFQDSLTGLYNARYLPLAIDRQIAHSQESGVPFALLFLDLDHFKRVNDLHGHQVGSQLLREVAQVLRRCVRDDDMVVRYGGDEFTLLLKRAHLSVASQIAERIRSTLEKHSFLGREGLVVRMTACIGIAIYPLHARSAEELIFLSDRAMYKGKNSTRNLVIVADPEDLINRPPALD